MRGVLSITTLGTALGTTLAALAAPASAEPRTVNGLYPLWEHTGEVHAPWSGQVGYHHAQLALGPLQIGTQPFLDLYGTVNAQAKLALWRGERSTAALTAGAYRIPAAAASRTIGNLHSVHLHNPYGPMLLWPVALAHTFAPHPRVRLHAAAVALAQWADDPRDRLLTGGATGLAEWRFSRAWAAMLHGGAEGLPAAPQQHVGLSFAYRLEHLDLRAGYAHRFEDGAGAGVFLFDGALVF